MHLKIIIALLFAAFSIGAGSTDLANLLNRMSKEDRTRFFTYQLYLGYFKTYANELTNVPEEMTFKIYDYFWTKYRMDKIDDNLLNFMTCQWIELNGECIDPDDPGIYPMITNENE